MRWSIGLLLLAALGLGPQPVRALANPASVFCVQSGGKSEIRTGPHGQYGVCRLPDGRVVEEWTYFREMKGKSAPAR
jgi:putative hemolysin